VRNAVISVACVLLALVAGIYLGGHPGTLPGPIRDTFVEEDRAVRSEIVSTIENNFYKPVDKSKLDDPRRQRPCASRSPVSSRGSG
jgi:hypothetical protein